MRYTLTVKDRFFQYVGLPDDSGCMVWLASIMPTGYGCLRVSRKTVYAHRLAYEIWRGPIAQGLQIDHLCRNRACVAPEHLEAVTQRENILRGSSVVAKNARKTQCPRGHEYPEGARRCVTCSRNRANRRYREDAEYRERCKARSREATRKRRENDLG